MMVLINAEMTCSLRLCNKLKSKEDMDAFLLLLKKERPESFKAYASMIDWDTMRTEFFTKKF